MALSEAKAQVAKKLVDNIQNDLKLLSQEARKKFPPVKDAAESGFVNIRKVAAKHENVILALISESTDITQPFLLGCDTKNARIVQICLQAVQRLICHEALSPTAASGIINCLWSLMESSIEELKLLQTVTLLLTTNTIVQSDSLSKAIVLCFRLHFTKDSTTINTASATVRQLVSLVFERVVSEDKSENGEKLEPLNTDSIKNGCRSPPKSLRKCAADAFMLFQDLVQLVNADQPFWLIGLTEMTRTFGLELVESILVSFSSVFFNHPEFSFLLKERVCPLVIKLFSPNIKYRHQGHIHQPLGQQVPADKPYFPISMRLLRVVSVLIQNFYSLLITECEIFLSLVVKFLDADKPNWQRSVALEVLYKMCNQPDLLSSFCECYDMKAHSTKIFQDIVNALGTYVQTSFLQSNSNVNNSGLTGSSSNNSPSPSIQGQPPTLLAGMPVGPGVTPQPAFMYRSVWYPIVTGKTQSNCKPKCWKNWMHPPFPEGYGISLGYQCLLDIVQSISAIIQNIPLKDDDSQNANKENLNILNKGSENISEENKAKYEQLINSSWCGLLAALSLLLDASTDETATENILKSMQLYASLCGHLQMKIPRDAFITAMCKASLPPHYTLTILNPNGTKQSDTFPGHARKRSQDLIPLSTSSGSNLPVFPGSENEPRQQVVAVGTALPTASLPLGAQQGPVMLTAKNLQCMRSLLSMAHCHGGIVGSAWHLVLTTLQHLVWILGLKPSTGGSLKAGRANEGPNAVITTAVIADLPVLSSMLSRLFESSQLVPIDDQFKLQYYRITSNIISLLFSFRYLNDVALHHLIDALCKLSTECMEMAYSNRASIEPSLFAIAKLLETGLVNLSRIEVLWKPVTNHLLEVCQHPHIRMREFGTEALTYLIKAGLKHEFDLPLKENRKFQLMLLGPIHDLSAIPHVDIRQKQLECLLQVLHSNGDMLTHGWPSVLAIIGAVSNDQGESLIRVAFQCLQLVVTDFLPVMPSYNLKICVETASKFGTQNQELNISLTAIGLLWNISDYLYQNRDKIKKNLEVESSPPTSPSIKAKPPPTSPSQNISKFDELWMSLFAKFSDLCVDPRPAVRKSAGQTLFSTVTAHGAVLDTSIWHAVLWKVFFPLLDKVRSLSGSASSEKVSDMGGNILIHHSRNTAQKQWAETQVLTLSGVARVFSTKRNALQSLSDFSRAWALLLDHIESSSLSKNSEVSLAGLKSFQDILNVNTVNINEGGESEASDENEKNDSTHFWTAAWKVWYNIGMESTKPPDNVTAAAIKENKTPSDLIVYLPSQPFLTALVQTFLALFNLMNKRFVAADLMKLASVLQNALSVPVHGDASLFLIPSTTEVVLTPLQEAVLQTVDVLINKLSNGTDVMRAMIPSLFSLLITFSCYACSAPSFGKVETKPSNSGKTALTDWVTMNYVPFAEKSMERIVLMYQQMSSQKSVIEAYVLHKIIQMLRAPLSLKYNCPCQSTWKLALSSLLSILHTALPIARKHGKYLFNSL
ncbi:Protein MON2 [Nymphon striatum]|nr:Protein MON2 [Nymphon striatum]